MITRITADHSEMVVLVLFVLCMAFRLLAVFLTCLMSYCFVYLVLSDTVVNSFGKEKMVLLFVFWFVTRVLYFVQSNLNGSNIFGTMEFVRDMGSSSL